MPIRFLSLLQDSWNFIQNQRQFTVIALSLLMAIQALVLLVFPAHHNAETAPELAVSASTLYSALVVGIANVYLSLLIILNVSAINQGQFKSFGQNVGLAFNKLFPAIGIYIMMSFPISMGVSSVLVSSGLNLISIPLLIGGVFIFLKLCLATYALIIEEYRLGQAVKFTWALTKGKMRFVFAYSLIANLLPALISSMISNWGNHMAVSVTAMAVSAFLSLFSTLFGFRFYQALRQMAS